MECFEMGPITAMSRGKCVSVLNQWMEWSTKFQNHLRNIDVKETAAWCDWQSRLRVATPTQAPLQLGAILRCSASGVRSEVLLLASTKASTSLA